MKTASKLPDLMVRIEALREQYRTCTLEERDGIQRQREALRHDLREQRHREHLADMELAQSMGECHFGSLDPTPHRVHHVPVRRGSWLAPVASVGLLGCIAVVMLLQYFDVLVLVP